MTPDDKTTEKKQPEAEPIKKSEDFDVDDETRADIEDRLKAYFTDDEKVRQIRDEALAAIAKGKKDHPKRTIFLVTLPENPYPFICRSSSFNEAIKFASAAEKTKSGRMLSASAAAYVSTHVLYPRITVDAVTGGSELINDGDGVRLFSAIQDKSGGSENVEVKNV